MAADDAAAGGEREATAHPQTVEVNGAPDASCPGEVWGHPTQATPPSDEQPVVGLPLPWLLMTPHLRDHENQPPLPPIHKWWQELDGRCVARSWEI